jgi:hypothetical protein
MPSKRLSVPTGDVIRQPVSGCRRMYVHPWGAPIFGSHLIPVMAKPLLPVEKLHSESRDGFIIRKILADNSNELYFWNYPEDVNHRLRVKRFAWLRANRPKVYFKFLEYPSKVLGALTNSSWDKVCKAYFESTLIRNQRYSSEMRTTSSEKRRARQRARRKIRRSKSKRSLTSSTHSRPKWSFPKPVVPDLRSSTDQFPVSRPKLLRNTTLPVHTPVGFYEDLGKDLGSSLDSLNRVTEKFPGNYQVLTVNDDMITKGGQMYSCCRCGQHKIEKVYLCPSDGRWHHYLRCGGRTVKTFVLERPLLGLMDPRDYVP